MDVTPEQRQKLDLIAQGFRVSEVARQLKMARETVRTSVRNLQWTAGDLQRLELIALWLPHMSPEAWSLLRRQGQSCWPRVPGEVAGLLVPLMERRFTSGARKLPYEDFLQTACMSSEDYLALFRQAAGYMLVRPSWLRVHMLYFGASRAEPCM